MKNKASTSLKLSVLTIFMTSYPFYTFSQTPAQCFANPSLCAPNASSDNTKQPAGKAPVAEAPNPVVGDQVKVIFYEFNIDSRKSIQKALSDLGHYKSSIDGSYGTNTRRAIQRYLEETNKNISTASNIRSELQKLSRDASGKDDNLQTASLQNCTPQNGALMQVKGVAADDFLNMRQGGAAKFPIVNKLAPDAKGLVFLGSDFQTKECKTLCSLNEKLTISQLNKFKEDCIDSGRVWYFVKTENNISGWASAKFLETYTEVPHENVEPAASQNVAASTSLEPEDNKPKDEEPAKVEMPPALPSILGDAFTPPFDNATKNRALIFLQDIEQSLKQDPTLLSDDSKIEFAKIYHSVRESKENKWSREVEDGMVVLQNFSSKNLRLLASVKKIEQIREEERLKLISKLRSDISQNVSILKTWVSQNLFDAKVQDILKIIEESEKALNYDDISILMNYANTTQFALKKYQVITEPEEDQLNSTDPSNSASEEPADPKTASNDNVLGMENYQVSLIGKKSEVGDGFTNYKAPDGFTLILLEIEFHGNSSTFSNKSFSISINTSSNRQYDINEIASEALAAQESGDFLKKSFTPDLGVKYFLAFETPMTDSEYSSLFAIETPLDQ